MLVRAFSTTSKTLLKDSSRAAAYLVSHQTISGARATGNSFATFAEYRKSAIQHGPLKKSQGITGFKPILTEYKDYGLSDVFAKTARSNDYKE